MQNGDSKTNIRATVIDDFDITEEEQSIILKYRNSNRQLKNVVHRILDCDEDMYSDEA
jgi:hypothetical protein